MSEILQFYRLYPFQYQDDEFAQAWTADGSYAKPDKSCSKCGRSSLPRTRSGPLTIQWVVDPYSPGSDVIADFYELGAPAPLMVSDRFRQFVTEMGYRNLSFGPVNMVQVPKLRKPVRPTSRTKKRVWLPYLSPPLHEWIVHGKATYDLILNQVDVSEHLVCSKCQKLTRLLLRPHARAPFIVKRSDWDGSEIFRLDYPVQCDCSDNPPVVIIESARDALRAQGFRNLGFTSYGYIQ
jgi:hypothetical protein